MRDTWPRTSQPHSADWGYTLGRLETKDIEQDRRITKLEDSRDKDKTEIDRLKTWAERAALLVVLYTLTAGLHWSAPTVGPIIGALTRSAISGLRGG